MKKLLSVLLALMLSCIGFASAEEIKPIILVVSFGTRCNDNRDLPIGAIEEDIAAVYSDYDVRHAFTTQTVIDSCLSATASRPITLPKPWRR